MEEYELVLESALRALNESRAAMRREQSGAACAAALASIDAASAARAHERHSAALRKTAAMAREARTW